jgi:hypothetical protein
MVNPLITFIETLTLKPREIVAFDLANPPKNLAIT